MPCARSLNSRCDPGLRSICFGDEQDVRQSCEPARRVLAARVGVIGREFRIILRRSLRAAIVFHQKPEALAPSAVGSVAVGLAAPVLTCGGGTPLFKSLVTAPRSGMARDDRKRYEHLVRPDCVFQVP